MRAPNRDDLLDAGLASLASGLHLAMAAVVDRFPPVLDFSAVFVLLPVVLSGIAALTLLAAGDRRPLLAACVYGWMVVLFTLPAGGLGVAWVPSAVALTVALSRPRLSSDRAAAG